MTQLTKSDVLKIINRYIGVVGGYLGDFSYRTHAEFYPEYCEINDIDPNLIEGTTRERFIHILLRENSKRQAQIVKGVIERFPVEAINAPATRTIELKTELQKLIEKLESAAPVKSPDLKTTFETVEFAINDAETLLETKGPIHAVDRIHTALLGYLEAVCDNAAISYTKEDTLASIFQKIRKTHPVFLIIAHKNPEADKIFNSIMVIFDALSPVRNNASLAHPNKQLIEEPEAMLVINVTRSLLHYFNAKIG